MDDLMQHILDLGMNAVGAGARRVRIRVDEDLAEDRLTIRVADDGEGMTPGLLAATRGRFATTKRGRARPIGLGLALLRQTAEACGGGFRVLSRPGEGTLVEARMRRSHIDRPPLGDCVTTALDLAVGNPGVGLRFTHCVQGRCHAFDSRTARRVLGEAEGLQRPEVMGWVRRELERGERDLIERRRAEGGRRKEKHPSREQGGGTRRLGALGGVERPVQNPKSRGGDDHGPG
jgi:hypothetical protein